MKENLEKETSTFVDTNIKKKDEIHRVNMLIVIINRRILLVDVEQFISFFSGMPT